MSLELLPVLSALCIFNVMMQCNKDFIFLIKIKIDSEF